MLVLEGDGERETERKRGRDRDMNRNKKDESSRKDAEKNESPKNLQPAKGTLRRGKGAILSSKKANSTCLVLLPFYRASVSSWRATTRMPSTFARAHAGAARRAMSLTFLTKRRACAATAATSTRWRVT